MKIEIPHTAITDWCIDMDLRYGGPRDCWNRNLRIAAVGTYSVPLDGKQICFTICDMATDDISLWEIEYAVIIDGNTGRETAFIGEAVIV